MARRTKETRGSRAEAKAAGERRERKKAGWRPPRRAVQGSREVIHTRAYWFDRARSLSELHGWPRADPGDRSGLVGRYVAATERPIGQLGCAELHTLLTQGTDPHFLVPAALERLGGGLGIDEREVVEAAAQIASDLRARAS